MKRRKPATSIPVRKWGLCHGARGVLGSLVCVLGILVSGCVEPYSGTRLEANISVSPGFDRNFLILPTPQYQVGEPGFYSHYELHARIGDGGWVRLRAFLIRPVLRVQNPCLQFTPDDFCIDVDGQPCAPWTNMDRYASLEKMLGVVSVPSVEVVDGSDVDFVPGFDFTEWPDRLFLDANLTPSASKLARENLNQGEVEAFCDALPSEYYVGNGAQLTLPMNGRLFGVVDGTDPRTGSPIGGISLNVPGKLVGMTELLITRETDPARLLPENIGRRDLPPGPDSQVFLVGQSDGPFGSIQRDLYRGVTSVNLESPYALPINMHVIVFEDIDEDPIEL